MSDAQSKPTRVVEYPHPTLRHESKPLRLVGVEWKRTVGQMFDLMYEYKGIGLSAIQMGLPYRLFILNVAGDPAAKESEHVFINPVIVKRSGTAEAEEGCLSLPGISATVIRSKKIVLSAFNLAGEEKGYQLGGLLARIAQHEIDHLDGVLFIDRLGPSARLSIKQALAELE